MQPSLPKSIRPHISEVKHSVIQKKVEMVHPSHEHKEEEVNEKWLISYSDLMTLLFGFFVILYSFAINNKSSVDEQLKSMTQEKFQPPPISTEELEARAKELQAKVDELEAKLREKDVSFSGLKSQHSALEMELLNLKKKEDNKPVDTSKLQILTLREDLKNSKAEKNKLLLDKEKLLAQLGELEKYVKNETRFILLMMKWSTDKHDIDLVVTDPEGKTFNFKNRKYSNHPGNFVLDSRSGPGVEIWRSDKILPGKYTVEFIFYQTYGNDDPAKITATILSPSGEFNLPEKIMNIQTRKSLKWQFASSPEGKITFVN